MQHQMEQLIDLHLATLELMQNNISLASMESFRNLTVDPASQARARAARRAPRRTSSRAGRGFSLEGDVGLGMAREGGVRPQRPEPSAPCQSSTQA